MKRLNTLIMILLVMAVLLAGCGSAPQAESESPADATPNPASSGNMPSGQTSGGDVADRHSEGNPIESEAGTDMPPDDADINMDEVGRSAADVTPPEFTYDEATSELYIADIGVQIVVPKEAMAQIALGIEEHYGKHVLSFYYVKDDRLYRMFEFLCYAYDDWMSTADKPMGPKPEVIAESDDKSWILTYYGSSMSSDGFSDPDFWDFIKTYEEGIAYSAVFK